MASAITTEKPVVIAGGGPVGLITALGLVQQGVPVLVLEEDSSLSMDTKAGTVLTRSLEVLDRFNSLEPVLAASVRIDEIGEADRASDKASLSVMTSELFTETRFPFVINIPQHQLEPVLRDTLAQKAPGSLRMNHRVTGFVQDGDSVVVHVDTPTGPKFVEASYLLACDGGRSTIREKLGITVEGKTLSERYMLIDLQADLDIESPRDYPYLSYFGDASEWMILVRQPHCWRFIFPLAENAEEPTPEELQQKVLRFIGDVNTTVIGTNIYSVHHRVASTWRDRRIFLMGDAAHLITPMWALGLNTGVLDASNLPWRLGWVHRGWADESLLDGYSKEQAPLAVSGSAAMAEAARMRMSRFDGAEDVMPDDGAWGNAMTRTLLGVTLDVAGSGNWQIIKTGSEPQTLHVGDRSPDMPLFDGHRERFLHELCSDTFVALYFTDARRGPAIPDQKYAGLRHYVVSRWDAPLDSGLRHKALFDPGDRIRRRYGITTDTLVLLRPDGHIAAIEPWDPSGSGVVEAATRHYTEIVGKPRSI